MEMMRAFVIEEPAAPKSSSFEKSPDPSLATGGS